MSKRCLLPAAKPDFVATAPSRYDEPLSHAPELCHRSLPVGNPRKSYESLLLSLAGFCLLTASGTVAAQETARTAASPAATPVERPELANLTEREATVSPFAVVANSNRVTSCDYHVTIDGQLLIPSEAGVQKWKLTSAGDFRFTQRRQAAELGGPLSLQAVRRFSAAEVTTTVGDNHRTVVRLPPSLQMIQVRGADTGLVHTAVSNRGVVLTRQHLDLLQMPGDPLICGGLMPSGDVKVHEKWNTDAWLVPMLTGLEAVIEQTATCEMKALDENTATVQFAGHASGAVVGSASTVDVVGELTFDRNSGLITTYRATQREDRSPGPISPGLKIVVRVNWTQRLPDPNSVDETTAVSASLDLPEGIGDRVPADADLSLQLQTPWRLQFEHSREWHVFNQSSSMLLLRQIRNGNLIAQCNLSPAVTVAPGQETPDQQFALDVQRAIEPRDGRVVRQTTVRDDELWRVRHIRATGKGGEHHVFWDYYLCSAKSGERFSFVFSHSEADTDAFGDEAKRVLDTITLLHRRPVIPFQ